MVARLSQLRSEGSHACLRLRVVEGCKRLANAHLAASGQSVDARARLVDSRLQPLACMRLARSTVEELWEKAALPSVLVEKSNDFRDFSYLSLLYWLWNVITNSERILTMRKIHPPGKNMKVFKRFMRPWCKWFRGHLVTSYFFLV